MNAFFALIARDVRLMLRQGFDAAVAVFFFALVAALFPFGVGPEPNTLLRVAPGVIWVSALLAALLSLDRVFQADAEDGTLDLLALSPLSLEFVVLAKTAAHWLTSGLPVILATPLVALAYGLPADAIGAAVLALLLGTPTLSLLGTVGAALTLGARRGGVLLGLLILPLTVPVLIFGTAAIDAALAETAARPQFLLLASMAAGALALAPFAAAGALRQALD